MATKGEPSTLAVPDGHQAVQAVRAAVEEQLLKLRADLAGDWAPGPASGARIEEKIVTLDAAAAHRRL